VNGWISNISALKLLWTDLNQNYDVKYLFTRRLTQDCVEVSQFLVTKKDIEKNRNVILISPERQTANRTETRENIQFEDVPDDIVSANSRSYVTGWVCSMLTHEHCSEKLSGISETCDPTHVHISMKKYSSSSKMLFPNDFASQLSIACMSVFNTVFYTFLWQSCGDEEKNESSRSNSRGFSSM
jgi:hypothetical protein